jgi:hypothetical protein
MKYFGNKTKWTWIIILLIIIATITYFFFYNRNSSQKIEEMKPLGGDTFEVNSTLFSKYSLFICTSAVVPLEWPSSPVKLSFASKNFLDASGVAPTTSDTFSPLPTNIIFGLDSVIKLLKNSDTTNIFFFFNKMYPNAQKLLQNIINVITGTSTDSIYMWFGTPSSASPGGTSAPGGTPSPVRTPA